MIGESDGVTISPGRFWFVCIAYSKCPLVPFDFNSSAPRALQGWASNLRQSAPSNQPIRPCPERPAKPPNILRRDCRATGDDALMWDEATHFFPFGNVIPKTSTSSLATCSVKPCNSSRVSASRKKPKVDNVKRRVAAFLDSPSLCKDLTSSILAAAAASA